MRTLKFGGTSLANAEKFLQVCNIIQKKSTYENISVVLSAPAKVTNFLEKINKNIKLNYNSKYLFKYLKNFFDELIQNIESNETKIIKNQLNNIIYSELQEIQNIINNIPHKKKNLDHIYAKIISKGEIISIHIMKSILLARKSNVFVINPVENILAIGNYLNATVQILESKIRINNIKIPEKHIILMPGFIAGNQKKELVTLGRNGSDYSASILAVCLNSYICEIWTDVDGIYITDPKIVPHSKLLELVSYETAIELSYLGAKILHPKTILPLLQSNIKCIIKNTYFPDNLGTSIVDKMYDQYHCSNTPIKGITYLNNITMFQIQYSSKDIKIKIMQQILSKFFKKNIDILITTFCNLKHIINFYVINKQDEKIKNILNTMFNIEIHDHSIKILSIIESLKIISIVGIHPKKYKTIQSKIISTFKYIDPNILIMSNQLIKNSISIVIHNANIINIIKKIYNIIFNKNNMLELFIIGCGGVGKTLIKQLCNQKKYLSQKNIKYKICGITNSKNMVINFDGIDLYNWKKILNTTSKKFCINKIIKKIKNIHLFNPVIIDCTASEEISNLYCKILKNNINIVTPNKKANTNSLKNYYKIRKTAIKYNKKFLYETNVSAGLPILQTLKNLFYSGDELISFRGILSGSLSFIFGKLEEGISISKSTKMAKKLGFTEPNPKEDLSGIDVARKLLILAREAGYKLELQDVMIKPILPKHLLKIEDSKQFLLQLSELDEIFFNKIQHARNNNKVLRFIGIIKKSGICQVKLTEVDTMDPLYNVKNGENALIIYSRYYQPIPLVLRGYGAGNNVTAAGIFSDLLKILS